MRAPSVALIAAWVLVGCGRAEVAPGAPREPVHEVDAGAMVAKSAVDAEATRGSTALGTATEAAELEAMIDELLTPDLEVEQKDIALYAVDSGMAIAVESHSFHGVGVGLSLVVRRANGAATRSEIYPAGAATDTVARGLAAARGRVRAALAGREVARLEATTWPVEGEGAAARPATRMALDESGVTLGFAANRLVARDAAGRETGAVDVAAEVVAPYRALPVQVYAKAGVGVALVQLSFDPGPRYFEGVAHDARVYLVGLHTGP